MPCCWKSATCRGPRPRLEDGHARPAGDPPGASRPAKTKLCGHEEGANGCVLWVNFVSSGNASCSRRESAVRPFPWTCWGEPIDQTRCKVTPPATALQHTPAFQPQTSSRPAKIAVGVWAAVARCHIVSPRRGFSGLGPLLVSWELAPIIPFFPIFLPPSSLKPSRNFLSF